MKTGLLFLTGPVGHGKTTLAYLIQKQLERLLRTKVNLLLAGSLIGQEIALKTELGSMAAPYFDSPNSRVPHQIVKEILTARIQKEGINLLEGVPRNEPQFT